jgi:hypothetical protein
MAMLKGFAQTAVVVLIVLAVVNRVPALKSITG